MLLRSISSVPKLAAAAWHLLGEVPKQDSATESSQDSGNRAKLICMCYFKKKRQEGVVDDRRFGTRKLMHCWIFLCH